MMGMTCEERLKNLAALALVGKCLVGLRSRDAEAQGVKDSGLDIVRISLRHRCHLSLIILVVGGYVFSIFFVHLRQGGDVPKLARRGFLVFSRDFLCFS